MAGIGRFYEKITVTRSNFCHPNVKQQIIEILNIQSARKKFLKFYYPNKRILK